MASVFEIWEAYVFAGVVAAAAGIYEHYKERSVPWPAFKYGLLAFLLASFFMAWREQYHAVEAAKAETEKANKKFEEQTQPKFVLGWGQSILGDGVISYGKRSETNTHIFFTVTVINRGAPSIITSIRLSAKLKDGKILEGSGYIPSQPEVVFHMPDGPIRFSTSTSLAARGTANPIPTGGQADGYVFFVFPPGLKAELIDPATVFTLEVKDVANNAYEAKILNTGPRATHMATSPGVLPKYQ
jgi:hypothetical protein